MSAYLGELVALATVIRVWRRIWLAGDHRREGGDRRRGDVISVMIGIYAV